MKIVYDNDISFRIAHALRKLVGDEHEVVALRDLFPESHAAGDAVPRPPR